jgi:predicted nucleic acid-binding protein
LTERFVDANVFIHAFIKPRRELKPHERQLKKSAEEIVKRIDDGERVVTTVVHFSEVANMLEDSLPASEALKLEEALLLKKNLRILSVSKEDYISALGESEELRTGLNDALAHILMQREKLGEIYSFDAHLDLYGSIKRLTL